MNTVSQNVQIYLFKPQTEFLISLAILMVIVVGAVWIVGRIQRIVLDQELSEQRKKAAG